MPATVFMLEIKDGFDVSTRSNIFPESNRLGSERKQNGRHWCGSGEGLQDD